MRKYESQQLKIADEQDRRNFLRRKVFKTILSILFYVLIVVIVVCNNILGESDHSSIVVWQVVFSIVAFIFSICLVVFLFSIVDKHFPVEILPYSQKVIADTTKPLRNFYRVPNDCNNFLVTKCYYCSDSKLTNKDVLIFHHGDNVRIVNDFFHSVNDFGCYEFSPSEATVLNRQIDGKITTIVAVDNFEIKLGGRTEKFILKGHTIH